MCTVINQTKGYHLFGRTLDMSCAYGEEIVVAPRGFVFPFEKDRSPSSAPLALMGIAHVAGGIPLYYDAFNEEGLCMAALRFPHHAVYHSPQADKINLASFALMPYLLRSCATMEEALDKLQRVNITPDAFSPSLPATPLHWMLSDAHISVVIESTQRGLCLHTNPYHVMTNAPDFPTQADHWKKAQATGMIPLEPSSFSRFARGIYANAHTVSETEPWAAINRFFRVMGTVSQPKGCAKGPDGTPAFTVYTSCGDPKELAYYVTIYESQRVRKVQITRAQMSGKELWRFEMA